MQTNTDLSRAIKNGSIIKASLSDLEKMKTPFCIYGFIFKNEELYDLSMVAFNESFQRLVDNKAVVGKSMRDFAPDAVEFWVNHIGPVLSGSDVSINNYVSVCLGTFFSSILAFPISCFSQNCVCFIFMGGLPPEIVEDCRSIRRQKVILEAIKSQIKDSTSKEAALDIITGEIYVLELIDFAILDLQKKRALQLPNRPTLT